MEGLIDVIKIKEIAKNFQNDMRVKYVLIMLHAQP